MVSNLYDVKDRSGKTIIENVTFGEVVEHLKCSKAQVNNSRASGDRIFGEYTVEMVDRKLSRRKDADLLREFDFIRFCLLAEIQERRQKSTLDRRKSYLRKKQAKTRRSGCITGRSDITKLSGNHGEAWQHLGR